MIIYVFIGIYKLFLCDFIKIIELDLIYYIYTKNNKKKI